MAKQNSNEGWTSEDVAGELEGEFIAPAEGLVIEGKLERAFAVEGEFGISAAYGIRGSAKWKDGASVEGQMILIGERPFFKNSIRDLKMDTTVRLTFGKKEKFGKKDLSMWKGELLSKRDGTGRTVASELVRYYKANFRPVIPMAQPQAPAEESVPF